MGVIWNMPKATYAMEHILAINMEFLHALWLYVIALYPMHERYRSDFGYIDIDYKVSI